MLETQAQQEMIRRTVIAEELVARFVPEPHEPIAERQVRRRLPEPREVERMIQDLQPRARARREACVSAQAVRAFAYRVLREVRVRPIVGEHGIAKLDVRMLHEVS